jgi:hypothetical protein
MSDELFHCGECGAAYLNADSAVMCCAIEINPIGIAYPSTTYAAAAQPPVPEPKAAELLGRAAKHMHERAATYDKPEGERSMGRAVDALNAVTGHTLKESEGWLFMALLKAVRSETRSEPHQDSLEDIIAYTALYAEARGDGR